MTREQKINYLRIAMNLQRLNVNNEMSDRIIETYETILKLGGRFSIVNAVDIEVKMDRKYKEKKLKEAK